MTIPISGPDDAVVHQVDGQWVLESSAPGQATVFVDHLSPFTWLENLTKGAVCLKRLNPGAIFTCLFEKGVAKVSAKFIAWLANSSGLGDACTKRILDSGGVTAFYAMVTGACVAHAGETYIPPTTTTTQAPPPTTTTTTRSVTTTTKGSSPTTTTTAAPQSGTTYHIEDDWYKGTWARTDPNNGTWYPQSQQPPNGAYWDPNGTPVTVTCARSAASYTVRFSDHYETWTWWLHLSDGNWYPAAATQELFHDGDPPGIPTC